MRTHLLSACLIVCLLASCGLASAQTPYDGLLSRRPFVLGFMAGDGAAIADRVSDGSARAPATLNFVHSGVRLGKVVDSPYGGGLFRNQFEIASEFTPFWRATYPKQQLVFKRPNGTETNSGFGYSTTGVSLTPVQLRLDFVKHSNFVPWVQIACGVLWTTRDFPTIKTASVNFMPQAGVGAHFFTHKHQSIDFAANAVHISNGDTADNNPGVNVTFQASVGYSWWFGGTK